MGDEVEQIPEWANVISNSLAMAMQDETCATLPPAVDVGSCLPRLLFEVFSEYLTGKSNLRRELVTVATFAMNKEDPLMASLDLGSRMMVWSLLKNLEAKRLHNERKSAHAGSEKSGSQEVTS